MNNYLHNQYIETKAKFDKLSSRLNRSQERGEFHQLSKRKQNFLVSRIKKLWEKLRILEVRLKIATAGTTIALMLMVSNVNAQDFVLSPENNPLPPPDIFGFDPILADIDADGDLDLLASVDYYGIDLFENQGTTSQPDFQLISDLDNPFFKMTSEGDLDLWDIVAVDDFDGDGDMDILSDDDYIFWNIGSNSEIEYSAEELESSIWNQSVVTDFDGDGDLDLLYCNSSNVRFYENTGDQNNFSLNYTEYTEYEIANWDEIISYVDEVRIIDFDNDNDVDFLLGVELYEDGMYSETAKLVENTGTLESPAFSLLDDSENPYSSLETDEFQVGDLDDDGDFDILLFSYFNGGLKFFEVDGLNLAENKELIPGLYNGIVLPVNYYYSPQFVDFDGDGDYELFTSSYGYYSLEFKYFDFLDTNEDVKYALDEDKDLAFLSDNAIEIPYFVDMDSDGDIDVVRIEYDYYEEAIIYTYLKNTGSDENPVYAESELTALSSIGSLMRPAFVDIDDDGDMDFFLSGRSYSGGDYKIKPMQFEKTGETDNIFKRIASKSDYSSNEIRFFENTGDGEPELVERTGDENPVNTVSSDLFLAMMSSSPVVFSDVDLDGDYDLLFTDYYGNIIYLKNTGTSTEAAFTDNSESGPFSGISAGYYGVINLVDFDDDGDDDLFVHKLLGMNNQYYENTMIGVGVADETFVEDLSLFPNPVNDALNFTIPNLSDGEMDFEILGLDGKAVMNGTLNSISGQENYSLPFSDYQSGLYILKVRTGEKVFVSKFYKN